MNFKYIKTERLSREWDFLKQIAFINIYSAKRYILLILLLLLIAVTLRNIAGRGAIYKKTKKLRTDEAVATLILLQNFICEQWPHQRRYRELFFFAASSGQVKLGDFQLQFAADFESLLYYIQHPKTLCYTALSLGGNRDAKGRSDGDKIICQDSGAPLRQPCLVYSFGGNDEWSFEEEIEKFGCKVYTFDPSLQKDNHEHKPNIWFHRIGISNFNEDKFFLKDMQTWKMRTLDVIMTMLGHENKIIDVLKMDIEGDEWNVLEDILNKKLLKKINHLCVEVHLHSMDWSRKLKILRRLEEEANMKFFSSRKNLVSMPRNVPGLYNRTEQLFYELAWFRDSSNL